MDDAVFIPIKTNSERVPGKNFLHVDGRPLYTIFPTVLREVFDHVFIDTDSEEVKQWAIDNGIGVIDRVPELASNAATGNMLLRHAVGLHPGYRRYWHAFITSPRITVETVRDMLDKMVRKVDGCDSVFSVKEHHEFFWNANGTPSSNYRPDLQPRSQDVSPLYSEVCGLFGLTADAFNVTHTRYGLRPSLHVLPKEQTLDIDWKSDVPTKKDTPEGVYEGSLDY